MSELVRGLIVFLAMANVGALLGLFLEVGRYFVPPAQVRGLFVASAGVMVAVMAGTLHRLHQPIHWWTVLLGFCVLAEDILLASLLMWFRGEEGGGYLRAMRAGPQARHERRAGESATERVVRRLVYWVVGLYSITLVVAVVVGFITVQTHRTLCTFDNDLAARVAAAELSYETSRQYVFGRDPATGRLLHPGPILGFPRSVVVANLRQQHTALVNQIRAHDSLGGLNC